MNVPQPLRALISKRRPQPVVNSPYPVTGRSGFPVADSQPGGR